MEKGYSEEIAEKIYIFLKEEKWKFHFDEEKGVFRFYVSIYEKIERIHCYTKVNDTDYNTYAIVPIHVNAGDTEEMAIMAKFLTMVNRGLRNGNFELNWENGEIRYKCYAECEDMKFSGEVFKKNLILSAITIQKYLKGMVFLISKKSSVKEAIALCEG